MDNCIEICRTPTSILFDLLNFTFVTPFKDSIASNMIALLAHILLDTPENISVVNTATLKYRNKILGCESTVGAAVRLARAWKWLGQELLAGIGRITSSTSVCVASYVTIGMTDVVFVLFLKFVVSHEFERPSPEHKAFVQAEPDSLQKQCIL